MPIFELQQLEERVLLSFHAYISGNQSISLSQQGATYTAYLHTTGGLSSSWSVVWGDGVTTPYGSSGTGVLQVTHTYPNTSNVQYSIAATATSTSGARSTAVFGLSSKFGISPTYSGTTVVNLNPGTNPNTRGRALAMDPNNGNLYVAGQYNATQFGLTRFLTNGSVDTSFGNNGTVAFSFDSFTDTAKALSVSSDGKFVAVVGTNHTGWAVAVYDMSGTTPVLWTSPTTGFWPTGDGPGQAGASANAVQWDGSDGTGQRLVIAGTDAAQQAMVTACLVQNGTGNYQLDTSWGGNNTGVGVITASRLGQTGAGANALMEIPLGEPYPEPGNPNSDEWVVGGFSCSSCCGSGCSASYFTLVRLNADSDDGGSGTIDTTFGTNGVVETANFACYVQSCCGCFVPSMDSIQSLVEWYDSSNSKFYIEAVGNTNAPGYNAFALARYDESTGAMDTRFGPYHAGVAAGPAGDAYSAVLDGPMQSNSDNTVANTGNLVVAGDNGAGDFLVARFSNVQVQGGPIAGGLDTTFGSGGSFATDFGSTTANTTDGAYGVVIESDGTIIAGGYSGNSIALAAFDPTNKLIINP